MAQKKRYVDLSSEQQHLIKTQFEEGVTSFDGHETRNSLERFVQLNNETKSYLFRNDSPELLGNFDSFLGTIIQDGSSIKESLQALETFLESAPTSACISVPGGTGSDQYNYSKTIEVSPSTFSATYLASFTGVDGSEVPFSNNTTNLQLLGQSTISPTAADDVKTAFETQVATNYGANITVNSVSVSNNGLNVVLSLDFTSDIQLNIAGPGGVLIIDANFGTYMVFDETVVPGVAQPLSYKVQSFQGQIEWLLWNESTKAYEVSSQPTDLSTAVLGDCPEFALKADVDHTHVESDITDLDKYTKAEVDALLASSSGGATIINELSDVDTVTSAPLTGDLLSWDGTNWVPIRRSVMQVFNTDATTDIDVNRNDFDTGVPLNGTVQQFRNGNSDFSASGNGILCNFTGTVLVSASIHIFSTTQRSAIQIRTRKNGVPINPSPIGSTGYIRNVSGHSESSLHITNFELAVVPGDLIDIGSRREGELDSNARLDLAGSSFLRLERTS